MLRTKCADTGDIPQNAVGTSTPPPEGDLIKIEFSHYKQGGNHSPDYPIPMTGSLSEAYGSGQSQLYYSTYSLSGQASPQVHNVSGS